MDALIDKSGSPRALRKAGLQVSVWEGENHTILKNTYELTKKEWEGSPRQKSMALGVKE